MVGVFCSAFLAFCRLAGFSTTDGSLSGRKSYNNHRSYNFYFQVDCVAADLTWPPGMGQSVGPCRRAVRRFAFRLCLTNQKPLLDASAPMRRVEHAPIPIDPHKARTQRRSSDVDAESSIGEDFCPQSSAPLQGRFGAGGYGLVHPVTRPAL
jgi:hypothetical protein